LTYSLDATLLNAISKAKTVGISLQPSSEAAFFSGFDDMRFEEGASMLPGLLQVCNRPAQ
jgi:hypothetical protein